MTAVNGCMLADGRLRACLILAASLIRLDIQELEGLNSMIKLAVARSKNNRLTLQLLTSRVCTRKIVSLYTAGAIKYKAIIPAAAALAKSAFLYHGAHRELLDDTERWQQCSEAKMVAGDPHVYDPAVAHTPAQIWAAKYNTLFMRQVRAHEKHSSLSRDTVFALLLPPAQQLLPDVWIVICVTRSQAMMLQASRAHDGTFSLGDKETNFMFSTSLIASLSERVADAAESRGSALKLHSQVLQVLETDPSESSTVSFQLQGEPKQVAQLRARYQRNTAEKSEQPFAVEDDDIQLEELDDGEHDGEYENDESDVSVSAGDAEADNEALMRSLHGWDDGDSGDNECDEHGEADCCSNDGIDIDDDQDDDVAKLDDLNIKLLAAATGQQSEAEAAQLNAKVEHVAGASVTSCTLSPVDAETEAILQEFLLSAHHMHEHPAARPSNNSCASFSAAESGNPQQRLGTASSSSAFSNQSVVRFCESWKLASEASVAALTHRHENSSRSLGDNRHLDTMLSNNRVDQASASGVILISIELTHLTTRLE